MIKPFVGGKSARSKADAPFIPVEIKTGSVDFLEQFPDLFIPVSKQPLL